MKRITTLLLIFASFLAVIPFNLANAIGECDNVGDNQYFFCTPPDECCTAITLYEKTRDWCNGYGNRWRRLSCFFSLWRSDTRQDVNDECLYDPIGSEDDRSGYRNLRDLCELVADAQS